jgi:hypothetical protein
LRHPPTVLRRIWRVNPVNGLNLSVTNTVRTILGLTAKLSQDQQEGKSMYSTTQIALLRQAGPTAVMPGIDTQVSNSLPASSLKSVTSITTDKGAPFYYNPTNNAVYVTHANVTLSGYNFAATKTSVLVRAQCHRQRLQFPRRFDRQRRRRFIEQRLRRRDREQFLQRRLGQQSASQS